MCGIFGFCSYGEPLSQKDAHSLVSSLGEASAERGMHATGISYLKNGALEVSKAPKSAYSFKFDLPITVTAVMGHTRHATQGDYKNNINNHPFAGKTVKQSFSLAHNGIISNDKELRKAYNLPTTKIETDSYIAVQLLNQQKSINMKTIKSMAEAIEGSFVFTILDNSNNLYFVKGNNPLAILHDKRLKLYIYASTNEILWQGISASSLLNKFKSNLLKGSVAVEEINVQTGEILKIKQDGSLELQSFDIKEDYWFSKGRYSPKIIYGVDELEYIEQLKSMSASCGYDEGFVEILLDEGYQFDEIEEFLYSENCYEEANVL